MCIRDRTYYEQQWLDRGLAIKYIKFRVPQEGQLQEPDVEIELDPYRSYNRSKRSGLDVYKRQVMYIKNRLLFGQGRVQPKGIVWFPRSGQHHQVCLLYTSRCV